MDLSRSWRLLLLLSALLMLGGFLATVALGRLASRPALAEPLACAADCAPRAWLDPEKARRFADVFRQ